MEKQMIIEGHTVEYLEGADGKVQVWEIMEDGVGEYVGRFDSLNVPLIANVLEIPARFRV